ncbi:hypothetical protein F511_08416 [Dorcoceras hygrometricum]|uniref:Uncharacterized protein n=1 Tax=Dorcoceras hygrometricum TaxID=472368 RepID=A0A2Z7CRD8_9LAMI|nr:hypothetical protein F511_08416 [Dorcoceras hygrometricum]
MRCAEQIASVCHNWEMAMENTKMEVKHDTKAQVCTLVVCTCEARDKKDRQTCIEDKSSHYVGLKRRV